jgi:hypothetical protein
MTVDQINQNLKQLYSRHYPCLPQELESFNSGVSGKEQATNPLLLQIDDAWVNADLKIMFFGKETTGWWNNNSSDCQTIQTIDELCGLYSNFYLSGNCLKGKIGVFWQGIKKIQDAFPNIQIGYLWNNLLKIGKCARGTPNDKIIEITKQYFNVLEEEIEILKPDIVVFFTGNYDAYIKEFLGDVKIEQVAGFEEKEFCKMKITNIPLSVRTYHPNYLRFKKSRDRYYLELTKQIKEYLDRHK